MWVSNYVEYLVISWIGSLCYKPILKREGGTTSDSLIAGRDTGITSSKLTCLYGTEGCTNNLPSIMFKLEFTILSHQNFMRLCHNLGHRSFTTYSKLSRSKNRKVLGPLHSNGVRLRKETCLKGWGTPDTLIAQETIPGLPRAKRKARGYLLC